MATMLELPRELYLMVCDYLKRTDLTQLARVSRDHYLAVQQPLFQHVSIYSFDSLVKLLSTVLKVPVVSHISPKQRRYWHKLSDAELRERDVKTLQIRLDSRKETRTVGAIVERCVNAIVNKCPDAHIHLILYGFWNHSEKQLQTANLRNIKKLSIYADATRLNPVKGQSPTNAVWDMIFSGSTFPDLQDVYFNATHGNEIELPSTALANLDVNSEPGWRHNSDQPIDPPYGLLKIEKITLEHNPLLTSIILSSLFNSNVIPKRLTTLEIVNCSRLRPLRDLAAIATLLERGLQLLQYLKLHITRSDYDSYHAFVHDAEIDEHPEHHICNVVREFGQKIKSLDLALPFACNRILAPHKTTKAYPQRLELPPIPQEPIDTLPQRLIKEGYRYRSLRVYFGICRGAHEWDDMVELAAGQGGDINWELTSERDCRAAWCVGGYAPVESAWEEEMELDESDADDDA